MSGAAGAAGESGAMPAVPALQAEWPGRRRAALRIVAVVPGLALAGVAGGRARAQSSPAGIGQLAADPQADAALAAAVRDWTGGAVLHEGRVLLAVDPLVENGNSVPLVLSADAAEGEERIVALALFNSRNPQPQVLSASFGPRAGEPKLATRIRLATSQRLLAVARTAAGVHWSATADVVVTLAACVE